MLLMDDTWKSNNGVHSESPSPVPSLINISNTSISLSSIEPPSHPTTNINLEMYERTTVSASSALSSNFGSFTFDFESINLDNDFQIDIPTITNSVVGGNDDSFKEPKSIERLFFGLFKHKNEVIQLDEDEATRTQVFGEKQVRRKHSLACLNFFKKEDYNNQCNKLQTAHYPKKSILKSKINQNYTIEQSQTKLDDSLSFSQFMDKFEHVESEKIGNEQRLSKLRLKQLRGYYSQLNDS